MLHGGDERVDRRRAELEEAFDVLPLVDRRLGELSRGQRRRAALVAALQLEAQLVLVDEATATLDGPSVVALRGALGRAASRGAGVLLVTHDRAFLETVADEVVALDGGRVAPQPTERCREPVVV